MADHTEFVELAQELISEEGRSVRLLTISSTPVDPLKPQRGSLGADSIVASPFAVFVPAAGSKFGSEWFDTELFRNCEQICLVAGTVNDWKNVHFVQEADDTRWRVILISCLKPANQAVLYMFGVAR